MPANVLEYKGFTVVVSAKKDQTDNRYFPTAEIEGNLPLPDPHFFDDKEACLAYALSHAKRNIDKIVGDA